MPEPQRFQFDAVSVPPITAMPAEWARRATSLHIAEIPYVRNSATSTQHDVELLLRGAALAHARFDVELCSLDLTPVRYSLARRGWSLPDILSAELQFLTFLQAVRREPARPQTPSAAADQYWHEFILITPLYITVCEQLFGRYLQHWPFAHMATGVAIK